MIITKDILLSLANRRPLMYPFIQGSCSSVIMTFSSCSEVGRKMVASGLAVRFRYGSESRCVIYNVFSCRSIIEFMCLVHVGMDELRTQLTGSYLVYSWRNRFEVLMQCNQAATLQQPLYGCSKLPWLIAGIHTGFSLLPQEGVYEAGILLMPTRLYHMGESREGSMRWQLGRSSEKISLMKECSMSRCACIRVTPRQSDLRWEEKRRFVHLGGNPESYNRNSMNLTCMALEAKALISLDQISQNANCHSQIDVFIMGSDTSSRYAIVFK